MLSEKSPISTGYNHHKQVSECSYHKVWAFLVCMVIGVWRYLLIHIQGLAHTFFLWYGCKKKYVMKYLLFLYGLFAFTQLYAYEPRGRMYDAPNIGLPSGNEVITGLIIAVITIPIGYLILSNSKNSTLGGLIGVALIGIGIITLLPTLAWLSSIIGVIVGIGFLVFIIIIIVALFVNKK